MTNINEDKLNENQFDFNIEEINYNENLVNLIQEKGEKESMKILLNSVQPFVQNQPDEVKRIFEYFVLKCS
jgi:hypothetical protein